MPALNHRRVRAAQLAPDFDRIRDLCLTLSHEPEQMLPTIAFIKRTFPERDTLLEMVLDLRKQTRGLAETAREGDSQRTALTAQLDQLLAALNQMKQAAGELRESAQSLQAVVTYGKAIQVQGKIAVMECLAKMLLLELE